MGRAAIIGKTKPVIRPSWESAGLSTAEERQMRGEFLDIVRAHLSDGAVVQFPDTDAYIPPQREKKHH